MENTTDILSRKSPELIVYSPALLAKVCTVAKTKTPAKTRRLLTKEEQGEMEQIHGFSTGSYFMFRGMQLCVSVRANGDVVLFKL